MKRIFFILLIFAAGINMAMAQCDSVTQDNPSDTTICYNASAVIDLPVAKGGDPSSNTYLWEESEDSLLWNPAQGTNDGQNYTTSELTSNMYYRRIVTSGCKPTDIDTSKVTTITVNPQLQISVLDNQNQTICNGSTPDTLRVVATGGNGTYQFQWQKSISVNFTNPVNVSGKDNVNTSKYKPEILTGTTYYRCVVTSCNSDTSGIAIITIYDNLQVSNPTSQSICSNSTLDTLRVAATGGNGTYQFQWQESINANFTNPVNVSGKDSVNTSKYKPEILTGTTYYRCVVTSCNSDTSAVAAIIVYDNLQISASPAPQKICSNSIPDPLSVSVEGGNNKTYQWEQSANGTSGWANVSGGSGATTADYTPPALTDTTYYRCNVTSDCGSDTSGVATITVNKAPDVKPIVTKNNGGDPNDPYILIYPDSTLTYQWYHNGDSILHAKEQFCYPPTYGLDIQEGTYSVEISNGTCKNSTDWTYSVRSSTAFSSVYPNPSNGNFTISFNKDVVGTDTKATISLFSLLGNKIKEQKVSCSEDIQFNGNISNGFYLLRIVTDDNRIETKQIIVKK